MKKTLLFGLLITLFTISVEAQSVKRRLEAGVAFANHTVTTTGCIIPGPYDYSLGVRVGHALEKHFKPIGVADTYLVAGINYKMGGYHYFGKVVSHAFNLPVNIGFGFDVSDKYNISAEFGPLLEYNFGKEIYKDGDKRFDVGLGGNIAFGYKKYYVRVGTEYGLLDLGGFKNKSFYVTVGFKFN